jgi:osmotically-inducible protein OsmY
MSKSMHRYAFLLPLVLIGFMGCASTRAHESTGQYVDDSVLTLKVKTAILGDAALKSSEINVESFKGVVQLSGFVNSQSDINHAVVVAQNVGGVTSVKNDMQLKP